MQKIYHIALYHELSVEKIGAKMSSALAKIEVKKPTQLKLSCMTSILNIQYSVECVSCIVVYSIEYSIYSLVLSIIIIVYDMPTGHSHGPPIMHVSM